MKIEVKTVNLSKSKIIQIIDVNIIIGDFYLGIKDYSQDKTMEKPTQIPDSNLINQDGVT